MKIRAKIEILLSLIDVDDPVCVQISGTLSAPDRPKVGEYIYWPYGRTNICDGEGGCVYFLEVSNSYWDTFAIGRIGPRITLKSQLVGESRIAYTRHSELEEHFDGARLLLKDPQVWWPESADYEPSWLPLPESVDDYPAHIKNMMIDD